jgi:hypothetical protein
VPLQHAKLLERGIHKLRFAMIMIVGSSAKVDSGIFKENYLNQVFNIHIRHKKIVMIEVFMIWQKNYALNFWSIDELGLTLFY